MLVLFWQKRYDVTGCEYYREAIDNSWGGFKIVQADAEALPFKDESFDIVGLFDVIEHFKDDVIPLKEAKGC
jgi:ubiquinone/menaquinone biosynthesis C-methylase UbiE